MFDTIQFLPAIVFGGVLAVFYFGGLWWTIRRLPIARHPTALYLASLLFRLAIVLASFFIVIVYCDWQPLVACLVGFLSARLLVIRFLGREPTPVFTAEGAS
jgi:F1F0 ATPase subunit 2